MNYLERIAASATETLLGERVQPAHPFVLAAPEASSSPRAAETRANAAYDAAETPAASAPPPHDVVAPEAHRDDATHGQPFATEQQFVVRAPRAWRASARSTAAAAAATSESTSSPPTRSENGNGDTHDGGAGVTNERANAVTMPAVAAPSRDAARGVVNGARDRSSSEAPHRVENVRTNDVANDAASAVATRVANRAAHDVENHAAPRGSDAAAGVTDTVASEPPGVAFVRAPKRAANSAPIASAARTTHTPPLGVERPSRENGARDATVSGSPASSSDRSRDGTAEPPAARARPRPDARPDPPRAAASTVRRSGHAVVPVARAFTPPPELAVAAVLAPSAREEHAPRLSIGRIDVQIHGELADAPPTPRLARAPRAHASLFDRFTLGA